MLGGMNAKQTTVGCLLLVLGSIAVGACGGSSTPPANDQTSVTVVKPGQPDPAAAAPAPSAAPAPAN
jgi:hypothetical protein